MVSHNGLTRSRPEPLQAAQVPKGRAVVRLNPQDAETFYFRGLAYRELGKAVEQVRDRYKAGKLGFDPS